MEANLITSQIVYYIIRIMSLQEEKDETLFLVHCKSVSR